MSAPSFLRSLPSCELDELLALVQRDQIVTHTRDQPALAQARADQPWGAPAPDGGSMLAFLPPPGLEHEPAAQAHSSERSWSRGSDHRHSQIDSGISYGSRATAREHSTAASSSPVAPVAAAPPAWPRGARAAQIRPYSPPVSSNGRDENEPPQELAHPDELAVTEWKRQPFPTHAHAQRQRSGKDEAQQRQREKDQKHSDSARAAASSPSLAQSPSPPSVLFSALESLPPSRADLEGLAAINGCYTQMQSERHPRAAMEEGRGKMLKQKQTQQQEEKESHAHLSHQSQASRTPSIRRSRNNKDAGAEEEEEEDDRSQPRASDVIARLRHDLLQLQRSHTALSAQHSSLRSQHAQEMAQLKQSSQAQLDRVRHAWKARVAQVESTHAEKLAAATSVSKHEVEFLRAQHEAQSNALQRAREMLQVWIRERGQVHNKSVKEKALYDLLCQPALVLDPSTPRPGYPLLEIPDAEGGGVGSLTAALGGQVGAPPLPPPPPAVPEPPPSIPAFASSLVRSIPLSAVPASVVNEETSRLRVLVTRLREENRALRQAEETARLAHLELVRVHKAVKTDTNAKYLRVQAQLLGSVRRVKFIADEKAALETKLAAQAAYTADVEAKLLDACKRLLALQGRAQAARERRDMRLGHQAARVAQRRQQRAMEPLQRMEASLQLQQREKHGHHRRAEERGRSRSRGRSQEGCCDGEVVEQEEEMEAAEEPEVPEELQEKADEAEEAEELTYEMDEQELHPEPLQHAVNPPGIAGSDAAPASPPRSPAHAHSHSRPSTSRTVGSAMHSSPTSRETDRWIRELESDVAAMEAQLQARQVLVPLPHGTVREHTRSPPRQREHPLSASQGASAQGLRAPAQPSRFPAAPSVHVDASHASSSSSSSSAPAAQLAHSSLDLTSVSSSVSAEEEEDEGWDHDVDVDATADSAEADVYGSGSDAELARALAQVRESDEHTSQSGRVGCGMRMADDSEAVSRLPLKEQLAQLSAQMAQADARVTEAKRRRAQMQQPQQQPQQSQGGPD